MGTNYGYGATKRNDRLCSAFVNRPYNDIMMADVRSHAACPFK